MRTIRVPGDKSISHRALMLAPLATGRSRLRGLADGADVQATADAMRRLGASYEPRTAASDGLEVAGPIELRSGGAAALHCANSGTTARLLMGLLAGLPVTATLDGDASLRRRPMDRVAGPLRAAGARIRALAEEDRLPMEVAGGALRPIEHESPVASAQVKSALLLAGLTAGVPIEVTEPGVSRDHTERMLRAMGVDVRSTERDGSNVVRSSAPSGPLRPLDLTIPGDFSSATFFIMLALLGGAGDELRIEGVGLNPGRTGFLGAAAAMGAEIEVANTRDAAGEPVGDLIVRPARLRGTEIGPSNIPSLLDEIPALACLASRCRGTTTIRGAAELRVKESDRLAVLARNLDGLGVGVEELADGLTIRGTEAPLVGRVATAGDHRIAMALGALGALPENDLKLDDRSCVAVSYPGFWSDVARVAGAAG